MYKDLPERVRRECDESLRRAIPEAHASFCKKARGAGVAERHITGCEDAFVLTFEEMFREGWAEGYEQIRHDLKSRAHEIAQELRGLTLDELLIEATGLTLQEVIALCKE